MTSTCVWQVVLLLPSEQSVFHEPKITMFRNTFFSFSSSVWVTSIEAKEGGILYIDMHMAQEQGLLSGKQSRLWVTTSVPVTSPPLLGWPTWHKVSVNLKSPLPALRCVHLFIPRLSPVLPPVISLASLRSVWLGSHGKLAGCCQPSAKAFLLNLKQEQVVGLTFFSN